MEHVISVDNMRESDKTTIESGVPSLVLMRRAAEGIRGAYSYSGSTAVVVGSGNNGGDGFALAEILASEGKPVSVFSVSDHYSEDSTYYMNKCLELGVPVVQFLPGSGMLHGFDTVVDCLLGTGFSGEVRGKYRDAINEINDSFAFVISADINSGMNGDTGEYLLAVKSDITVTIGYYKTGLVRAELRRDPAIGALVCTDIGIGLVREENYLLSDQEWLDNELPPELEEFDPGDGHIRFRRV